MQKKNDALEKLRSASRTRSDKIAAMATEIDEVCFSRRSGITLCTHVRLDQATKQVEGAKRDFEEVSNRLRMELERFDRDKVASFATSMRGFLRSILETQKEVWTCYTAQNGLNGAMSQISSRLWRYGNHILKKLSH